MSEVTEETTEVVTTSLAMAKADERMRRGERPPMSAEMSRRIEIAEVFARSGFFADATQVAKAAVKLMIGEELGIPAVTAMTNVHVFGDTGKTSVMIGAHLLAAQIRRSKIYDYKIIEANEDLCTIEFWGVGRFGVDGWQKIGTETFTYAEAQKANLTKKDNYQRWRVDMLYARCMARGQRRHCPDATGVVVYVPEEMDDRKSIASAVDPYSVLVAPPDLNVEDIGRSRSENRGHGEEGFSGIVESGNPGQSQPPPDAIDVDPILTTRADENAPPSAGSGGPSDDPNAPVRSDGPDDAQSKVNDLHSRTKLTDMLYGTTDGSGPEARKQLLKWSDKVLSKRVKDVKDLSGAEVDSLIKYALSLNW